MSGGLLKVQLATVQAQIRPGFTGQPPAPLKSPPTYGELRRATAVLDQDHLNLLPAPPPALLPPREELFKQQLFFCRWLLVF